MKLLSDMEGLRKHILVSSLMSFWKDTHSQIHTDVKVRVKLPAIVEVNFLFLCFIVSFFFFFLSLLQFLSTYPVCNSYGSFRQRIVS